MQTWEGKETVLKALIQYTKNSTYWTTEPKIADQVEKIVLRESKRNNPAFRHHALECLADFVELRREVDMYPQVYTVVNPIIEECLENREEMDVDSKSGGPSSKAIIESTLANSAMALLQSVSPSLKSGEDLSFEFAQTLELLNRIRNENGSRKALDKIYDAEKLLFEKTREAQPRSLSGSLESVMIEYVEYLFTSTDHVEQTRIKAAEAAVAMAQMARHGDRIKNVLAQAVATAKATERSASVQQALDRALKLLRE